MHTSVKHVLLSLLLSAYPVVAIAGLPPGGEPPSPEEPPITDDYVIADTLVLGSSIVANQAGTQYSYQALDAEGNSYTALIDVSTGEVSAASNNVVIANVLSQAQRNTVASKYVAAGSPPMATNPALQIPPAVTALMCYVNDQITKAQERWECYRRGGLTPVYYKPGSCGEGAAYYCKLEPLPNPSPTPLPTPTPPSNEYWTLPDATNISSQFQFVVNTSDRDWFGQ